MLWSPIQQRGNAFIQPPNQPIDKIKDIVNVNFIVNIILLIKLSCQYINGLIMNIVYPLILLQYQDI